MEFLLALPLLGLTFFFLIQFSFLMYAKVVLHSAAFAAARSAAVWIPREMVDGPAGPEWRQRADSEAAKRSARAAALACTSISPAVHALGGTLEADLPPSVFASGIASLPVSIRASLTAVDHWHENWDYALRATEVTLSLDHMGKDHSRIEIVTAEVHHKLYLFAPFAGSLLGLEKPPEGLTRGWGGFLTMDSTCSLPLEIERHGGKEVD